MISTTDHEFGTKSSAGISRKLFSNTGTADVHFVFDIDGIEQHIVPAHKNILSMGSPVFHAMFYGECRENGPVKIVDASRDGFKDFLTIFYHDKVTITNENVAEFTYLSSKYDVPEGLQICEQYLSSKTTIRDLCSDLSLATKFDFNGLRNSCENRIRTNAGEVFKMADFINSPKEIIKLILELDGLNCSAEETFNACMAWAENATGTTDRKAIRDKLGECFYLIPFKAMKIVEFSNVVSTNKAVFCLDEVADIMAYILTGKTSETTEKFSNNWKLVDQIKFNWDEGSLIKCTRERLEFNRSYLAISRHEYTVFSVSKKVLLGGFRFFTFKPQTDSFDILSATITTENHSKMSDVILDEKTTIDVI